MRFQRLVCYYKARLLHFSTEISNTKPRRHLEIQTNVGLRCLNILLPFFGRAWNRVTTTPVNK